MKKLLLLTGLLVVLPVVARAEMCIDFDDDMNVIEYDCSKSFDDIKREKAEKQAKAQRQKEEEYKRKISIRADGIANVLADLKFYVRGAYGLTLAESKSGEGSYKTDNGIYGALGMRFNSTKKMFYDVELAGAYIPTRFDEQLGYTDTYTNWADGNPYTYERQNNGYRNIDIKTYNLMLNFYTGYKVMPTIAVYGGAGIGYTYATGTETISWNTIDVIDGVPGNPYDEYVYSYDTELNGGALVRLALGTELDLGAGLSVFAEYAYMMQWLDVSENSTHNLLLGAKYTF